MSRDVMPFALCLMAAGMLAACASLGSGGAASEAGGDTAAAGEGIRTTAIRTAPAARQAANPSRPLSELNTPEAIAARETLSRTRPRSIPAATPTTPQIIATRSPAIVARQPAPAATAPLPKAVLQKGSKVRARNGAVLRERPAANGAAITTPALRGELELGAQIYNAAGYWWYVTSGQDAGWLLQTDILP